MHHLKNLWMQAYPQPLHEGIIPNHLRLLVMGPHPDDFDSIAVTLRHLYEAGNPLHVAVIRTGSGVEDDYLPDLTLEKKTLLRDEEQRASVRFFGLPEEALMLLSPDKDGDDQMQETAANVDMISQVIEDAAPDIIFLPHGNDTNNGHRVTCAIVRQVVARLERPVVLFLNLDAKTIAMRTDLYMPFGEDMARWKAELLRFHDTQQQRNLNQRGHGFDERVLMLNAQTASDLKIEAPYAEAFELEFYNVAE